MKTIAKMMSTTFLLVGMFSCIKTDILYDDGQTEIAMRPVMSSMSKAPITGTTYPEDMSFGVIAYYYNEDWENLSEGNAPVLYIDNKKFVNQGDDTFGGSDPCYWPHQGSLIFAGYSPYSDSWSPEFNCLDKTLSIKNFEADGQTDLMYFLPDVAADGNLVSVLNTGNSVSAAFSHALTLLEFNIYGLEGDETIKIKDVTISGWRAQGNFSVTVGEKPEWTENNATEDKQIYTHDGEVISRKNPITIHALAIPGDPTDITITYDIHAAQTHTDTATITATEITEIATWEAGKKYIYDITIATGYIVVNLTENTTIADGNGVTI